MRRRTSSGWATGSRPKAVMRPRAGVRNPRRVLRRVVLPAPFGPRRPVGPAGNAPETPERAWTRPYETVSPWNSTSGSLTSVTNEAPPVRVPSYSRRSRAALVSLGRDPQDHSPLDPHGQSLERLARLADRVARLEGEIDEGARGTRHDRRPAGKAQPAFAAHDHPDRGHGQGRAHQQVHRPRAQSCFVPADGQGPVEERGHARSGLEGGGEARGPPLRGPALEQEAGSQDDGGQASQGARRRIAALPSGSPPHPERAHRRQRDPG